MSRWFEAAGFHLLLLTAAALLGWLSHQYNLAWDWSDAARNSLHPASRALIARLDAPLRITSFAPENPVLRGQILEVLERYRRLQPLIEIDFVNPAMEPARTRELGIQVAGELHLSYQGRSENLRVIDEQSISNTI
ncbi:MAG: hypothetical protein G8D28_01125 [gamma proteobacterium symbiont of Phacoides pectinatus]